MTVTLFMAISLDGYIADSEGGEDFLSHENWKTCVQFVKEYGNLIVGRKTYEAVKAWDEEYSFDQFASATKVILTKNNDFTCPKGYFCATSPSKAIEIIKKNGLDKPFITGGAEVNASFLREGLISDIFLNINPVVLGDGKNLFAKDILQTDLKLEKMIQLPENIVQLHYKT